jgi:SPP1 gp7 family putative phage head morphogenesis protein
MRDKVVRAAKRDKLGIIADAALWDALGQRLFRVLLPGLEEASAAGVELAAAQFYELAGYTVDWSMVHGESLRWARERAGELVGTRAEKEHPSILRVTRQNVKEAVTNWIEAGEPLEQLVQKLEPTFGRERADMIATTEITRARYEGNLLAYREAGVEEHEWDTARDSYVCEICIPMQGVRARVGEQFLHPENGNYYKPPAHPRCRCDALPLTANA